MSVSASDGAEKLSALAEELSGNDPELVRRCCCSRPLWPRAGPPILRRRGRPSRSPANPSIKFALMTSGGFQHTG